MISKEEKKRIKEVIGHRYVSLIQEELNRTGEMNLLGLPYSSSHITNVLNGEPHAIVEAAIYRVVEKQKKMQEARKTILT